MMRIPFEAAALTGLDAIEPSVTSIVGEGLVHSFRVPVENAFDDVTHDPGQHLLPPDRPYSLTVGQEAVAVVNYQSKFVGDEVDVHMLFSERLPWPPREVYRGIITNAVLEAGEVPSFRSVERKVNMPLLAVKAGGVAAGALAWFVWRRHQATR